MGKVKLAFQFFTDNFMIILIDCMLKGMTINHPNGCKWI